MKKLICLLFVILTKMLLISLTGSLYAQTVNLLDKTVRSDIDKTVVEAIIDNGLPGVALGLIYDGQIVYTKAYGWANMFSAPMSTSTVLRWGSISKTLTSLLAMKLLEEGHIDLNKPVISYIADYDNANVTVRHLLCHQAGMPHYNQGCDYSPFYSGGFDADATLEIVEGCSLLFDPGDKFNYTSFGFNLLGVVVEKVGMSVYGKGFVELFEDWVKDPFGLTSLEHDDDNVNPLMATGYTAPNTASTFVPDVGWKLPAGGFASNINNLCRYMLALMNSEMINSSTSNTMWMAQKLNDGTPTAVGLGVFIDTSSGNLGIGHGGISTNMSTTLMEFFPNQKFGIVIMTNAEWYNVSDNILSPMKEDILDILRCPVSRLFVEDLPANVAIHYEADDYIEASINIFPFSNIILDAGYDIYLTDGFHAREGASFQAVIDGCGGFITPFSVPKPGNMPDALTLTHHEDKVINVSELSAYESFELKIMPNPFVDVINIEYRVTERTEIGIFIYDLLGIQVEQILPAGTPKEAGTHILKFDATHLPAGQYFCEIRSGKTRKVEKMICLN